MKKDKYSTLESFNFAIDGLIDSIKSEKNMRFHIFASIFVVASGIIIGISKIELFFLIFAVSLVIICELFNTAIEYTIDIILGKKYHILAKKAKDISAGAVLVSCINATLIGYLVFIDKLKNDAKDIFYSVKYSYVDVIPIILALILIVILTIKAATKSGRPLSGGMPSGHSALAFSLWTCIFFVTDNLIVLATSFVMAILVSQSRIESKIHSIWEVILGGIIGGALTFIILNFIKTML